MIAPARIAAYEILRAVSDGRSDLSAAIASSRGSLDDERDRALAADIALGVERRRATLDHLIAHFAKRPIDRLDPEVLDILRLSTYQLLHLTRVPAAAAVNDAVKLARRAGKTSAAGFVNAMLRSLSRGRRALPLPARPDDADDRDAAIQYLTVVLSHPRWLVERWHDRFGFAATEAWLAFNNTPAPLTLRVNGLRASAADLVARLLAEGVVVHPARYAPDALVVDEGAPLRGAAAAAGLFVAQDEASQLIALLPAAKPGVRLLDVCASPGGKTTALASAMQGSGLLVASDVRDRRVALLRETLRATGATGVRVVQADALAPLPFTQPFDVVLLDAPCSGLGTLRRDPDIRWRRREEDLVTLAAAQLTMLQRSADAVAPGGRLVYATCSSEPEENEAVVDAFLLTSRDFTRVDLRTEGEGVPRDVVDERGHLRTYPHVHGLEAFFGAVLRRT